MVIEDRPDNGVFLKPVATHIVSEPPFLRREGMGGARYLRHCLESAGTDAGGSWPAGVIQRSLELLVRIDDASTWTVEPEIRDYRALSDTEVRPAGERPWKPDAALPFSDGEIETCKRDYPGLLSERAEFARADLHSQAFSYLWREVPEREFAAYRAGFGGSGKVLTALLAHQAWLERRFLAACADTPEQAGPVLHELVSARYIRTLCLVHRCERTAWNQPVLWPEITEFGRTILMLYCCGWKQEAAELSQRARPMLHSRQNQFVPLVPWFGCVWCTQDTDALALGAVSKFHQRTYHDLRWVLGHWRGDDLDGLAERLARIADRRRWAMGQFDDEYHVDFDDGFSWTVPYEVGAVLSARKRLGLPVPKIEHPLFDLPTAEFPLADGPVTQFQDIYARYIREI